MMQPITVRSTIQYCNEKLKELSDIVILTVKSNQITSEQQLQRQQAKHI